MEQPSSPDIPRSKDILSLGILLNKDIRLNLDIPSKGILLSNIPRTRASRPRPRLSPWSTKQRTPTS